MGPLRINAAAPNLVNLCIDHLSDGEYSGRIYHKYVKDPLPFNESGQMIAILDKFFDEINYPQASTKYRTFQKKKKGQDVASVRYQEEKKQIQTAEDILQSRGKEATFILHVQYRQNSTWQGKLTWLEEEDEELFSSVLELLKLLDSAIFMEEA